jgi:hypothetical protein
MVKDKLVKMSPNLNFIIAELIDYHEYSGELGVVFFQVERTKDTSVLKFSGGNVGEEVSKRIRLVLNGELLASEVMTNDDIPF